MAYPPDVERSGLPVAVFRVALTNPGIAPVEASVAFALQNFIGDDGVTQLAKSNRITPRASGNLSGLVYETGGVPDTAETWGNLALAVVDREITYRTAWAGGSWGRPLLDFWDDFAANGTLSDRADTGDDRPTGTVAARVRVAPGATETVTFLLTWCFPNRQSWTPDGKSVWMNDGANGVGAPTVGNYYAARLPSAWNTAEQVATDLPALDAGTVAVVNAFCASDLPDVVKEAAWFNLSTLRTQTVFRTPDGRFFGWEGTHDRDGSCFGSCTHVWNYEQATAFLFAPIARSFRDTEYRYMTDPQTGHMAFRVGLPLESHACGWEIAAADGQMGCVMKLYRDWKLCGDADFLRGLWQNAKQSLAFACLPGGWDADRDGVMEGCQHNTMDVDYHGANGQMTLWYLGALRAGGEMATAMGDTDFADECRHLFETGSRLADTTLFNGEYYEHHIAPCLPENVRAGLAGGTETVEGELSLQLGAGCLIDQLVGQYMADVCGLGYLVAPQNVDKTLSVILRYNRCDNLWGHFNPMRSYALDGESALLMASYPRGNRPTRPFPYFGEVMTGFEYTMAALLMFAGRTTEGVSVVAAVRERYDGCKRNPFNEAECGNHYARAMASWACVLAITGQRYDAHTGTLAMRPLAAHTDRRTDFFATGDACGTNASRGTRAKRCGANRRNALHGRRECAAFRVRIAA